MKKAFVINKDLECEKICRVVGELLNQTNSLPDRILILEIRSIIDSNESLLPKLEDKTVLPN